MLVLEKKLEDEIRNREKLEQEKKRVVKDYERSQMERAQERGKYVKGLGFGHEFMNSLFMLQ